MKRTCFVISIVIHVIFVYWFTTLKFSRGTIAAEAKKKEIVIVTPVKLFTPTIADMPVRKEAIVFKQTPQLIANSTGQNTEQPGTKKVEQPKTDNPGKKEANPKRRIVKIFDSDPDDTGLNPGRDSKPGNTDPSTAPRFSLNPETMRRIVGTGGSRRGFFSESPGLTTGGTGFAGSGSFFQVQGCNILPWAGLALRKVKQNWVIPAAAELGATGLVGVSLTVERDGRMSSITISQSSQDDSLDQAALTAFAVSNPLPHLPDDFPYRDLHAYFLFNYNEREITSPMKKEH